jgi:hypothetical protein
MNAVEIEEAITSLAESPFDPSEFPYQFLQAFGNKETTIKRLTAGATNKSDVGGVLQHNNIHIAVAANGEVTKTLATLKASPATAKAKAQFVLATDGDTFEAENLESGETVACAYADFPNHFGYFLPLAGITTVKQVRESAFDIRATGRLNKLYVELLRENPEWGSDERRHDMNHFMARLIFCFFAEDTDIFNDSNLFTDTIATVSAPDASNTHEVVSELFRSMNTKHEDRESAGTPRWAAAFPCVNGGLFSGSAEVPRFSKIARSYLLHIGNLDWTKINPDIFGSMIQAVADDEERGALGMHYTSRPNILKVLDPLFLDDLRAKLEEAGGNARKLLNLRNRVARIRVFDPACGSGNFLVIAYKEMRAIEAEINRRRGEPDRPSDIPLTNFRGIEIRDFAAEIARLALIIAEFQCDSQYRGKQLALAEFLPLKADNWITCDNALTVDWLSVCPPTGTGVKLQGNDLFSTPLDQVEIDFENEGGETYICGNPPYTGYNRQSAAQKADISRVFNGLLGKFGNLDYVCCWFAKAALMSKATGSRSAFVATNSICQGTQVCVLWPLLFKEGQRIFFARTSFRWSNLAARNAGVTVIVVGLTSSNIPSAILFEERDGNIIVRSVDAIGPYLAPNSNAIVEAQRMPLSDVPDMSLGNHPYYASQLIMECEEARALADESPSAARFLRSYCGSSEIINGTKRYCIWVEDPNAEVALQIPALASRFEQVRLTRASKMNDASARALISKPWRFRDQTTARRWEIAVPQVSSERRPYLPVDLLPSESILSFKSYAIYDGPLWTLAIICSRLHLAWVATVCARMRTDYSYTNTLAWNAFPVPTLTDKNRTDLTRCAEDILLEREECFPATIAELYDPDTMPPDLRAAHERNDEVLERIYLGRRFKNDTERLEKLFDMYTKMVAKAEPAKNGRKKASA